MRQWWKMVSAGRWDSFIFMRGFSIFSDCSGHSVFLVCFSFVNLFLAVGWAETNIWGIARISGRGAIIFTYLACWECVHVSDMEILPVQISSLELARLPHLSGGKFIPCIVYIHQIGWLNSCGGFCIFIVMGGMQICTTDPWDAFCFQN